MTLREFYKKLQNLDVDKLQNQVLEDNANVYADANAVQQFNTGLKADGTPIGQYSPFTIREKMRKGQPTDRMTLEDTKDFHKGFYGKLQGDNISISSNDTKTTELISRYGEDIFGLMANYRYQVSIQVVLPDFIKLLKQKLNLKS